MTNDELILLSDLNFAEAFREQARRAPLAKSALLAHREWGGKSAHSVLA